jgi:leucine dehydrogenase
MISSLQEFDNHKFIHIIHEPAAQLKAFVAIHRGDAINPSFGATRLWKYDSEKDALNDALRLARLMSSKAAHAGLRYGGGKAVIMEPTEPYNRKKLLKAYAHALNDLNGRFVTGTDVGLNQEDILEMNRHCRHLVGMKVDPTIYTALGVIESLKAIFLHLDKSPDISGKSYAIQGLGKIGFELLNQLSDSASVVYASEIKEDVIATVREQFPNVVIVPPKEIHKQKVDVFLPCALSHAINENTIHELNCRAIAGAANNQLSSPSLAQTLLTNNILYAPDYVVNAGGLMSVVHEYEQPTINEAILIKQVETIFDRLTKIFSQSNEQKLPTAVIANQLAEQHLSLFSFY